MLDILTSVSPPQNDSLSKNRRMEKQIESGPENFRNDFKENLKSQIKKDQKKIDLKEKPKPFNAEQKESQPGEIKKRVAKEADDEIGLDDEESAEGEKKLNEDRVEKFDPTMISMNMVSIESEVEVPDLEENLAMIEESNTNINAEVSLQLINELSDLDLLSDQVMQSKSSEVFGTETSADLSQAVVPFDEEAVSSSELTPQVMTEDLVQSKVEVGLLAFQQKVMEALKNEKMNLSVEKLEEFKDKLIAMNGEQQDQISGQQVNSKTEELGEQLSEGFDQQSSADAKSSKEELSSKDHFKMGTHYVGQSEFGSQLATQGFAADGSLADKASAIQNSDLEPNVKELLNQANYLVTKGGGEVTLKMNSMDGMGEVHLKVMMDNGKMNIELNTQDKSVKKLIEDSLSDLRSSLASRQISLEHVKINSVNATSTENNSQSMQNNSNNSGSESNQPKSFAQLQQQMQQQSQQHQMRQQSQNSFSRNNFNLERPVVLPMVNVQKSIAKNYYGLNKGNALNAVA